MLFTSNEDKLLVDSVRDQPALYQLTHKKYKNSVYKDQLWTDIATSLDKSNMVKARWKNIRDTYNKRRKRLGTGSRRAQKHPWLLEAHLKFLETIENPKKKSSTDVTPVPDDLVNFRKKKCVDVDVDVNDDDNDDDDGDNDDDDDDDDNNDIDNHKKYLGNKENGNDLLKMSKLIKPCPKKIKRYENHLSSSSVNSSSTRISKSDDILPNDNVKLYKSLHQLYNRPVEDPIDLFFKSVAAQVKELPPHIVPDVRMKITNIICEYEKSYKFSYGQVMINQQQQPEQNLNSSCYQIPTITHPLIATSSSSTDCSADGTQLIT
ncbi:putative uncharacterized protein DDB_G0287265 isoform X2 [Aphidius gifuensis]|uniref:putative uncharacterized protein DDB_G0287265 isoform X2 n=1 Tax=Aphidius gifuensis TaxID=684658 RepID=UPI001CDD2201|nr:putative uncharacterized protein DDB_G0287265 isoform X2 [Aphidius gifuensis]